MALGTGDFAAYFSALWSRPGAPCDPYPWQTRLVEQIDREGRWPDLLDLPTGAGKTSALDIALFLLALDADRPPSEQRFPRRTILVVDRRTIVDQGLKRAQQIREKLSSASDGILRTVADRLRGLHDQDAPVATTILRGAMARDDAWIKRPDLPLLALSTVDQVGSRLLFRGYGVSDGMKPVHAGMLGSDCLYLLDEVHLSVPFEQTLSALVARQDRYLDVERPRVAISRLSATAGAVKGTVFGLQPEDRANGALRVRLNAEKPARLQEVKVQGEESVRVAAFSAEITAQALGLARPDTTVGVVVNRVETARQVARALDEQGEAVALITGRMRPLDRAAEEDRIAGWVDAGRKPMPGSNVRFIVATQCIEAGADYDFDALVTECAPLDALRQRLGRLNRSGLRDGARAVIAMRGDDAKNGEDPVYGDAAKETWAWLGLQENLNFKIEGFELPEAETFKKCLVAVHPAPHLLPAYLDAWVQTSPVPFPDPDISLFLHGPQREQTEVSVIWRADLAPELFTPGGLGHLKDRLEAVPPGSLEAVSIPIVALRRWLNPKDRRPISLSDAGAETVGEDPDGWRYSAEQEAQVLRWEGEDSALVSVKALRPGDTIVLPSSQGGLFKGTFDPSDRTMVRDLGDEVQLALRGRPTMRLHPGVHDLTGLWDGGTAPFDDDDALNQQIDAWLDASAAPLRGRNRRLIEHVDPSGRSFTLVAKKVQKFGRDVSTDPATSSHTGVRVTLDYHLGEVGRWAKVFAERGGLGALRIRDLESAGRLHDVGKADRRFQLLLHNGNRVSAALDPEPLAKSAAPAGDREARIKAQQKSGYPKGARHELMSLALLEAAPAAREEVLRYGGDWDLVCYLVASHHGFGRPFAPVVPDDDPVDVTWNEITIPSAHGLERLDSGVSERFWRLVRRYGAHGLARYEALLRLADQHESALEQGKFAKESP